MLSNLIPVSPNSLPLFQEKKERETIFVVQSHKMYIYLGWKMRVGP
jgi:hypothetical protein